MTDRDEFMDAKARIPPDEHRLLSAIAAATDQSINEIVSGLIHQYLQAEIRKHNMIASAMRVEGTDGTRRDSPLYSRRGTFLDTKS